MKIPYGKQEILREDIDAVISTLNSDFITQGPIVAEFEKTFANYVGSRYAVAVANGTAALHLSALALGVQTGHKIITTPNTFAATANCILYCGGQVEFSDINLKDYCLDLDLLEDKIKKSPESYKGIIAVDFAGHPLDWPRLKSMANKYNLWLMEDACHAVGGEFLDSENQWHKCGSGEFADLSVFSFHPVKHITTGEGGMITTNSEDLYNKIRLLRSHGITKDPANFVQENDGPWYYEMQTLGFNYRISDILCALGLSQLKRIDQNLLRRRELALMYDKSLDGIGDIKIPGKTDRIRHAYHLYVVQTQHRKELYKFLIENQIYCQVHYIPIYRQPYYKKQNYSKLENTEHYYSQALSLPMYHSLTNQEQEFVIEKIREFFG